MTVGTLRDQVIYPHQKEDMAHQQVHDHDLEQILDEVEPLNNILFESINILF